MNNSEYVLKFNISNVLGLDDNIIFFYSKETTHRYKNWDMVIEMKNST